MGEWISVGGSDRVQTWEYSFGPGLARTFAVLGPEGWVVVSPTCEETAIAWQALETRAPIAALVAPNPFHTMGLRAWREHAPRAPIFAPAQSIARTEKKGRVEGIRTLADAQHLCGDAIDLLDMPHYKTGEALVRVRTDVGVIWHVTDVIFNWPKLPPNLLVKFIFSVLTDSAPGFKLSAPAAFLMMKDKRAVYAWLKEQAQLAPPVRLVPSHGGDVVMNEPGRELIELLTRQGKV